MVDPQTPPESEERKELSDVRELIKQKEEQVKKLKLDLLKFKYIAWSFAEMLNKHDVESEEVLNLRKELDSIS